jgi:Ca-activated chloride channel family protein
MGQNPRLEFAGKPVMVNCNLAEAPCFRLRLNIVDEKGLPSPVELPQAGQLVQSLTIRMGERAVTPFYVSTDSEERNGVVRPRVALILIDVSGSMNARLANGQTRFEAAKAAALMFLDGFEDGLDKLAIVPFGSRDVDETIRACRFAKTKEDARLQIRTLPIPEPRNNTALYSALSIALDVLGAAVRDSPGSPETMLVVMTDGKNDVGKGDDPALLTGDQGLQTVERKVKDSGIPVHAIGFGNRGEVDEAALRRIGTKYDMSEDPDDLKRLFPVARALLNSRIRVTMESPWKDRASLAGRTFKFVAELHLPNGNVIHSGDTTWSPPQMAVPLFEGKCDESEARALLVKPRPPDVTGGIGIALLRPVGVFLGLSGLLLLLWFGLPRLLWPTRYEPESVPLRPDRWMGQPGGEPAARGRKPPPGFDKREKGIPERAASDKTIVSPRKDFSTTRSRLE